MFLGSSRDIQENIVRLMAGHDVDEPIAIAVAFWGEGAEALLPADRRFRLICNLSMGGTNPAVIETLLARPGIEVRHLPDLHAKVVLTASGAVVSSANFSANGLGLEDCSGDGWQEAGIAIPATDPEFVKIYAWFEARWRAASAVDGAVLEQARKGWLERASLPSIAMPDASEASPVADADTPPELQEADLFQQKTKPRNALRMAADWLVAEYKTMRGSELSTSDHFIPAYAAHVLWTLAGNRIATNIPATPEFSRPEQVLRRAEERGKDNPDRVRSLIARLARLQATPPAVRYWAQQWMDQNL